MMWLILIFMVNALSGMNADNTYSIPEDLLPLFSGIASNAIAGILPEENKNSFSKDNDRRPYVCDECGKRFVKKGGLGIHKTVHKNPESCPVCSKEYKYKKSLRNHIEFVHARK